MEKTENIEVDYSSMHPKHSSKIAKVTNVNKIARIDYVKGVLEIEGIFFLERMNGHLTIDGISIWATTEKWYNPFTGDRGKGLNGFLKHLQEGSKTNEC